MANRYGIPETEGRREARGASDLRSQRQAIARPTNTGSPTTQVGEFRRGLVRGTGSVAGGLARGAGAAARAVGAPELAEAPEAFAERVEGDLVAPNAPRVSSVFDIRTDDAASILRDSSDYLNGLIGSQVPVLSSMAAGAGVGGAAARGAGALAGAGLVSGGMQAGETAGAIQGDLGRPLEASEAQTSLGAGALGGALEMVPFLRAAKTLGVGQAATSAVQRGLLSRAGREAVLQAGAEGGTEALQQLVQRGARQFVNDNFDALGPDAARELLDAAVGGAIIGGGMGAVSGALEGRLAERGEAFEPDEAELEDLDIGEIIGEEELRGAERNRLQSLGAGDDFAEAGYVDEDMLDQLRGRLPQLRESSDLDYQAMVEENPAVVAEVVLDKVLQGQELSRREAVGGASALRAVMDENPEAARAMMQEVFKRAGPEQAAGLEGYMQEVLGDNAPRSGDLGSSLTQLDEATGDQVIDYSSIKTREANRQPWVGDNQSGTFFRDHDHVDRSVAALEKKNPNIRYEKVPARAIVEAQLEESYGPQNAWASVFSQEELQRMGDVEGSLDKGQLPQGAALRELQRSRQIRAGALPAHQRALEGGKPRGPGPARRAAEQELLTRAADSRDPLKPEVLRRVRDAARALDAGQMPQGVTPGEMKAARKLVEDPLSIFDGRFALVPTNPPRQFSGGDPTVLSPDRLRPELTREQKAERRSKKGVPGADRKAIDKEYRKLRDRKAIVRKLPEDRGFSEREFGMTTADGKDVAIYAPNLVRQMVRIQRIHSGRNLEGRTTPQEAIDGFIEGLAELHRLGMEGLPNDNLVILNRQRFSKGTFTVKNAIDRFADKIAKLAKAEKKKGGPYAAVAALHKKWVSGEPTPQEATDEFFTELKKLEGLPADALATLDKDLLSVGTKSIEEPVTFGEVRERGVARLRARQEALDNSIASADTRIASLEGRMKEATPELRKYYRGQIRDLKKVRGVGPEIVSAHEYTLQALENSIQGSFEGTPMGREEADTTLQRLGSNYMAEVDNSAEMEVNEDFDDLGGEDPLAVDDAEIEEFLDIVDKRVARGEFGTGDTPVDPAILPTPDEVPPTPASTHRGAPKEIPEDAGTTRTGDPRELRRASHERALAAQAIIDALPGGKPRESQDLPGYEFDAIVREMREAPTHQQDKRMVRKWAKQLGLPESVKLMSTSETLQLLRAQGDISRIHRIEEGTLNGLSFGDAIWVTPRLTNRARLELLAHEMGHVIANHTAPLSNDAIYDAWTAWRTRMEKPGLLVKDVAQSKQAFATAMRNFGRADSSALAELNQEERTYLLDYEEWFSDQVARHLAGDPSPVAEVRTWIQRFIDAIKKLFGMVREQGYRADPTVVEFLDRMTARAPIVMGKIREAAEAEGVEPSRLFASIVARDPGDQKAFVSFTKLYEEASKDMRRVLGNAFGTDTKIRRDVINKLRAANQHAAAETARTNLEAAVAYGTQLWAHGEINPRGGAKGALEKFRDHIFDLLGEPDSAADVERALEALRLGQVSTFEVSKARRDNALNASAQAMKSLWEQWGQPLARRVVMPAFSRLEATGVPSLVELSRMFHDPAGEQAVSGSYLRNKTLRTSQQLDRLYRVFGDNPSRELLDEVHQAMQRGEEAASPEGRVAQRKLRALLVDMFKYLQRGGALSSKSFHDSYYPRVWSVEGLQDQKARWVEMASDPAYRDGWAQIQKAYQQSYDEFTNDPDLDFPGTEYQKRAVDIQTRYGAITLEGVIDTTYSALVNEYGTNDLDLASPTAGSNPFVAARNRRVLDFLFDAGPHRDEFFKMLAPDLDYTMRSYIEAAAKRVELDALGGVRRINNLMHDAAAEGATAEDMKLASDYVEAMQGTLGHQTANWVARTFGMEPPDRGTVIDPRLQRAQSVVMLWQNLRVLALAGFTSLADPVGIAVRGGGVDATAGSLRALRQGSYAREVAEGLGIINTYAINETLGGIYGSNYMVGRTQAWNQRFFKLIGLEYITRTTRAMATGGALAFLKKHVQSPNNSSERFLGELNLSADDVRFNEQGEVELLTRWERDSLYEENTPEAYEELARDDRVRQAIGKFVDEAVLRPTAATRPIWASDPHAALVFHLKSFIYTFHSQILRRVWTEGVEHNNMLPLLALTAFVPAMVGSDILRDVARHGVGGDPKKEDWSATDWALHGAERAGLPGLATFLLDAQQDREWGGIGIESALGPTFDSLTAVDDVILGDDEGSYNALLKQLPFQNTALVDPLRP